MDEETSPLIYGSIIKIKTVNGKYDNQLFFIHYITKSRIELLSNVNMKEIIINIDDEGRFDDMEIESFQVLYTPSGGYAQQHGLKPGNSLDIHFNDPLEDNREIITGNIVDLEEDMISLDISEDSSEDAQLIYIDFHYSGIDPQYNIKKIILKKKSDKTRQESNEFFIDLKESEIERIREVQRKKDEEIKEFQTLGEEIIEEVGDQYIQVYSVEQQIDDYIENAFDRKVHKKKVMFDVSRYQQLLEKYVDLPNGIYYKSYTKQSVSNYFSTLQIPYVYPSTSYAYKQMMSTDNLISNEIIDVIDAYESSVDDPKSRYNVLLSNPNDILGELENYFNVPNITYTKQKKSRSHKLIRYPIRNRIYLNNIEPLYSPHNYAVKKKVLTSVPSYYTELEPSSTLILDGFMFPSKAKIGYMNNVKENTTLFDKSLQNLYPIMELGTRKIASEIDSENKCNIFHDEKMQYIPFQEGDRKLNDYFERLGFSRKMIYECYKHDLSRYRSRYGILSFLSNYGIRDADKNIISEMNKFVSSNTRKFIKENINAKNVISKKNMRNFNYKINHDSKVILELDNTYQMANIHTKSSSEIVQETIPDNHNVYMLVASNANQNLSIYDRVNAELPEILRTLEGEVQNYLMNIDNEDDNNSLREVVKEYETFNDMMKDSGKMILMDPLNKNVYDIMYGKLVHDHNYNEDINVFVSKVKKILASNDLDSDEHEDLFEDKSVLQNLYMLIIHNKVGNNEKVLVKDKKEIYIYKDGEFIKQDDYNNTIKKKKILSVRNRDMDFDEVKRTRVNDFVVNLVEDIKRKNNKKMEIKSIRYDEELNHMRQRNIRIRNQRFLDASKYDREKNNLAKIFSLSGYLNNVEVSPFKGLFLYIISLEDSEDKFEYLQKLIQKFTHDTQDPEWLKCIKTNTNLVPKYFLKLIDAYLVSHNYDKVLDMICNSEGTINDTNDAWIHTSSGYILKKIEFDDSDIYDRNSMLNLGTNLLDIDDDDADFLDELEEVEDVNSIASAGMINLKINKRIVMNDEEKQIQHLMLSFTNIMGVKIDRNEDKYTMIKEMNNIYKNSIYTKKQDNVIALTFSILGTLLAYIQCYDINPKKSFPGCVNSFAGYPLDDNLENNDGMVYIACILHLISKNNPNLPYVKFSKSTKQEIYDKFLEFIQGSIVSNNYVFNLISNARLDKLDRYKQHDTTTRLPSVFKPSLKPISLVSASFPAELPNKYDLYQSKKTHSVYMSKMLESAIQELMMKEQPLLMTKYAQPFLVNFCCNESVGQERSLMEYLSKSGSKDELISMLRNIIKNKAQSSRIFQNIINTQCISVPSNEVRKSLSESSSGILDKSTIFQYFIYHFNFDNTRPIPSHLREFDIQKPSEMYYNRRDPLEKKIKALEENGYEFSDALMNNVKTKINNNNIKNAAKEKYLSSQNRSSASDTFYKQFVEDLEGKSRNEIYRFLETSIRRNIDTYRRFLNRFNDSSIIRACNKILNEIMRDNAGANEDFLNNKSNLHRHINYLLINIIPQILLKDYKMDSNRIVCKHWNLAINHNTLLKQRVKSYLNEIYKHEIPKLQLQSVDNEGENEDDEIDMLQKVDAYTAFLEELNKYSSFVSHDSFSDDKMLDLLFQKYLTVKILNIYTLEGDNLPETYTSIDENFIIGLNKSLISYIELIMKKTRIDYDLIKKRVNNTKLSEKKMTTDYFKNMKRAQRMAEKTKMNLKLGIWAFALDKNRVYKYSKKYFDEDRDEAMKVQKMVNDDYTTNNESLTMIDEVGEEGDPMNIEQISMQEMEPMMNIPDEDFMDDAENYNY